MLVNPSLTIALHNHPMSRILSKIRSHGLFILVGIFYLYLALHAISGSQGMFKLAQYEAEIADLQAEIVQVKAERLTLERHAKQLRSSSLNRDTLDEEARRNLSVSHVKDIVIVLDE